MIFQKNGSNADEVFRLGLVNGLNGTLTTCAAVIQSIQEQVQHTVEFTLQPVVRQLGVQLRVSELDGG